MATKNETVNQLKVKLADAWLRGKEQRIEIGTLLLELRAEAEHGDWGNWLKELCIPASTAADYMQEASRQIHGIRVFENNAVRDAEGEEIQQAVAAAIAAVNGEEPPPPKSTPIELPDRLRVKGPVLHVTAEQKDAWKTAKREDKDRVYAIFHKAFLEVIGESEEVSRETFAA